MAESLEKAESLAGRERLQLSFTSTTLLEGLRDPDNDPVWAEYVGRNRPVLVHTLRQSRVPAEDAEDIAQVVLLEFVEAYRNGRYRRDKGRLRSWLFGILRNQLRNWRRREAARAPAARQSAAEDLLLAHEGQDELERVWDEEWGQTILRHVLSQVRSEVSPERWKAFEHFVLEERSAAEAAELLGETAAFVYASKRRILERIRTLQPLMSDLF